MSQEKPAVESALSLPPTDDGLAPLRAASRAVAAGVGCVALTTAEDALRAFPVEVFARSELMAEYATVAEFHRGIESAFGVVAGVVDLAAWALFGVAMWFALGTLGLIVARLTGEAGGGA